MGTLKLTDRTSKKCWQIEVFTSVKFGDLKLKKEQKSALKAEITSKTIASLSEYFINGFGRGFCSRSSRKSQRPVTVFLVKSQEYLKAWEQVQISWPRAYTDHLNHKTSQFSTSLSILWQHNWYMLRI